MIKKIIASTFLLCLFIAIPLSLMGLTRVSVGGPFLTFLKACSQELNGYSIAIPDIPSIPLMENVEGFLAVLNVIIKFFNGLISIINIGVLLINKVIELLEFIFIVLKNLIRFKDTIATINA